jgi:Mn-dependent DtxR family transcriptional regulator
MPPKSRSRLILTAPQADCLAVLRTAGCSKSKIAIEAKRSIKQTDAALGRLAELGLAERTSNRLWVATSWGKTCRFATILDRSDRSGPTGPGAARVLDLLDRPMRGRAIARRLAITPQRVRQLLVSLHARGYVAFGDAQRPFWLVKRAGDERHVLSRDEERVLSALPLVFATDAHTIGVVTKLSESEVERTVENLIASGLAQAKEGVRRGRAFRITASGVEHPQYDRRRQAPPERLPVRSDRVRRVLQEISDAGALRIREVCDRMQVPRQSINALMQYLKRKQLLTKAVAGGIAPYSLTEKGRATLAEMTLREAA